MRNRYFEAENISDREAIRRELEDSGISDPDEWREIFDLENEAPNQLNKPKKKVRSVEYRKGKIEDTNWQASVDEAFENGKYYMIKMLRRVRPEIYPNYELVKVKLHELITTRPKNYSSELSNIKEVTNLEPDPAVVLEEFDKIFELLGQEEGVLVQLENFIKATRFKPELETVQAKYTSILAGKISYHFFSLEDVFSDIKNLTGVVPDNSIFETLVLQRGMARAKNIASLFDTSISSEIIQEVYTQQLKERGSFVLNLFPEMGEIPNEKLIQQAYQKIVNKNKPYHWSGLIQELRQATNVEPVFDELQILQIIERYFKNGNYHEVENIIAVTGIKFEEKKAQKACLEFFRNYHSRLIDNGKSLMEEITRFREMTEVGFEIPEKEIQTKFQESIAKNYFQDVLNLYGAFGIRPSVDHESARLFMLDFIDENYQSPLKDLEKVFGFKLEATDEEIEDKYSNNLDNFKFYTLSTIKEITGKDCDREKIEVALLSLLQKEALNPTHSSAKHEDWDIEVLKRFEEFDFSPSTEQIFPIYEKFFQGDIIYAKDLLKIFKITGIQLSSELAQQAYQKIFETDISSRGDSKKNTIFEYGISGVLLTIQNVSGEKSKVSAEKIQNFYRSQLELGEKGYLEIQKVSEILSIRPEFDSEDINILYKSWIFNGKEEDINKVKKITGVELTLDKETLDYISRAIEEGLAIVQNGDYKKEEYGNNGFQINSLHRVLEKIKSLELISGVSFDISRLQTIYSDTLENDPYWVAIIEEIYNATGIMPEFSQEQIQAKGQEFLEKGEFHKFEKLKEYGIVEVTPEISETAYDFLSSTIIRYDKHERRSYYNGNWVDRFHKLHELSGESPTEAQSSVIFLHLVKDKNISRHSRDRIGDSIELLENSFSVTLNENMVRNIFTEMISQKDVELIKKFIEKVGYLPTISEDFFRSKVDQFLDENEIGYLNELKNLGIEHFPASEDKVQAIYEHLIVHEDFGETGSDSLEKIKQIFSLTGVPAIFPSEQVDHAYASTRFKEWFYLKKIMGKLPTSEIVQNKYYQFLTGDHFHLEENIKAMNFITGQGATDETVSKALEFFLLEVKIDKIINIQNIFNGKLNINPEIAQKAYQKLAEQVEADNSQYNSLDQFIKIIKLLNENFGIKPNPESVFQIFQATIGKKTFHRYGPGIGSSETWAYLVENFGEPDPKIIQRIYLKLLVSQNLFYESIDKFNFVEQYTKEKPDIKEMVSIEKERGIEIDKHDINVDLQDLFLKGLLEGKIDEIINLETKFGRKFFIKDGDLQVLYAQVLLKSNDYQKDIIRFLRIRTGIYPSEEITNAKYQELFGDNYRIEDVKEFKEIVIVSPPREMVQKKYKKLFENFIKYSNNSYEDDDFYEENNGDLYYEQYSILAQVTGVKPKFDRGYADSLFSFCINSGPNFYEKIGIIARETGFAIEPDIIQKCTLDNPEFSSKIPFKISNEQLNKHFANSQNNNLEEYKRIYKIFGCFEYYQGVLAKLEQEDTREAKQSTITLLATMALRDVDNADQYVATKEKIMSFVEQKSTPINKAIAEALAELVKNGDADLTVYLASTLRERSKRSGEDEGGYRTLGFSSIQEVALRTFFHIDNPLANEQLLSLVHVQDIDPRVRSYILQNLATEKHDFFPKNMASWVEAELRSKKSKFVWRDVKYFQAVKSISSADLRSKSLHQINSVFGDFIENNTSPSDLQEGKYEAIPDNSFLSLWKFSRGNQKLLDQFNELYKVTKSSTERDSLLFGIVNALLVNKKILSKFIDRLSEIELAAMDNASELSVVLKTLSFLDTVENELGESGDEILEILDSPGESLGSLNESLKKIAVQKIKKVLPHEDVNIDKIETLWDSWGSLEPVFVYAGKMASGNYRGTLKHVAEMVANLDAPDYERWKQWRYNLEDTKVQEQIGHLSEQQLELWKNDCFSELGDVMIATTPSDKPKHVFKLIQDSLNSRHIYNPEIHTTDRHEYIQERLSLLYDTVNERPEQKEEIFNGAIELLRKDIEKIDAIIRFSGLSKLENVLTSFVEGDVVAINAKTKNLLGILAQFLPKDQYQEIENIYKKSEKSGMPTIDSSSLISSSIRDSLKTKEEEIKKNYEEALQSGIFMEHNLNKEQVNNVGQFYQKRKELKALYDLYRISVLDVKKIATNRISDYVDKKGETLIKVIDNLKKYFKDNQVFVQDIENISSLISQKEDLGAKRHLAMIITDNPQVLFQAGKYPSGCGSCQNYEGSSSWNVSLAGYVSDAHIKVVYLIDLNKLSESQRNEIETSGFEEVKNTIPYQDLLEASIARTITKLTRTEDSSEQVLFIEPTYSSVNKDDLSMDRYFDLFLEIMVTEPMKIKLARGGGKEQVRVPRSRNPGGQYEDCEAGNAGHAGMGIMRGSYNMPARFVDKFSPVTDIDRKLADRIFAE